MIKFGENVLTARAHIDWNRLGEPDACRAIRPNDTDAFVPVYPQEQEWTQPGVSVVHYVDDEGAVWGSLTTLEPKVVTRATEVSARAGGLWHYYENHYPLLGSGELDVWYQGTQWQVGGKRYDIESAPVAEPLHILRGDTYRLQASDIGMAVLSLYPEVSLEQDYHNTVVTPPTPLNLHEIIKD